MDAEANEARNEAPNAAPPPIGRVLFLLRAAKEVISVFGSYVRDEQEHDSDLDILVDLGEKPTIDLLDLVNLERYLSNVLGLEVDVTVKSSLRKRIGQRILDEATSI